MVLYIVLKHDDRMGPDELGIFMGVYASPEAAARDQNVALKNWDDQFAADGFWSWIRPEDGTTFTLASWTVER